MAAEKHYFQFFNKLLVLIAVALSLCIVACSGADDESSVNSDELTSDSDLVVSTYDDLLVCSSVREGDTAYVKESQLTYICKNGDWTLEVWNWDFPKESYLNPDIDYGILIDERDGQTYRIVRIGDQTWMAENLNYADSAKSPSLSGKSWCYKNVAQNCDVGGRLYTWGAAIDSIKIMTDSDNTLNCGSGKVCGLVGRIQGVCPNGWHLPDTTEWNKLFVTVGGKNVAGRILKSQTGWNGNRNGSDSVGFSALPVGILLDIINIDDNAFFNEGNHAYFWSSTDIDDIHVYGTGLDYLGESIGLSEDYKILQGRSVRCIKDEEE